MARPPCPLRPARPARLGRRTHPFALVVPLVPLARPGAGPRNARWLTARRGQQSAKRDCGATQILPPYHSYHRSSLVPSLCRWGRGMDRTRTLLGIAPYLEQHLLRQSSFRSTISAACGASSIATSRESRNLSPAPVTAAGASTVIPGRRTTCFQSNDGRRGPAGHHKRSASRPWPGGAWCSAQRPGRS